MRGHPSARQKYPKVRPSPETEVAQVDDDSDLLDSGLLPIWHSQEGVPTVQGARIGTLGSAWQEDIEVHISLKWMQVCLQVDLTTCRKEGQRKFAANVEWHKRIDSKRLPRCQDHLVNDIANLRSEVKEGTRALMGINGIEFDGEWGDKWAFKFFRSRHADGLSRYLRLAFDDKRQLDRRRKKGGRTREGGVREGGRRGDLYSAPFIPHYASVVSPNASRPYPLLANKEWINILQSSRSGSVSFRKHICLGTGQEEHSGHETTQNYLSSLDNSHGHSKSMLNDNQRLMAYSLFPTSLQTVVDDNNMTSMEASQIRQR